MVILGPEHLPYDLLQRIICSCNAPDGMSLASTSSFFYNAKKAIEPHSLWRCFCVNRFNLLRDVMASLGGWPENMASKDAERLRLVYHEHETRELKEVTDGPSLLRFGCSTAV